MTTAKSISSPCLGRGIYRVADVARYTRVPASTVRSWFKTAGVLRSDYSPIADVFSLSFLDLVDTLVAHQFRKRGVTMRIVRRAYTSLQNTLQVEHPFCHRDLYTDGRRIIVSAAKQVKTAHLQDAISGQRFFDQLADYLERVSYSEASRIAQRWMVSSGVAIDPNICMGQPVLNGTGVTSYVVYGSFIANKKNKTLVSSMYGISASQVADAVAFEESLKAA